MTTNMNDARKIRNNWTIQIWLQFERIEQGFVKGEVFCFRYPYFYFWHGESTSTASHQTFAASQLSKDLNKVPLHLQNLGSAIAWSNYSPISIYPSAIVRQVRHCYVNIYDFCLVFCDTCPASLFWSINSPFPFKKIIEHKSRPFWNHKLMTI